MVRISARITSLALQSSEAKGQALNDTVSEGWSTSHKYVTKSPKTQLVPQWRCVSL